MEIIHSGTPQIKTANEQLKEKIIQYTLPDKAKKALDERMELNKQFEKIFNEYNMCLQLMICPKCGEQTIREETKKLAFNQAHQRKDLITQVIKCTSESCEFTFNIPEPHQKQK